MIADVDRRNRRRHVADVARPFPGRDDRALEALLGSLSPRLLNYATRHVRPGHDAADVVAQVLLTVWRRRDDLPLDDDQAAAWVFGVARNTVANHRRGQVRRQALADRLRDDLAAAAARQPTGPAGQVGPAGHASGHGGADEQAERVREALDLLSDDDRELICLVVWDGFGIAEAGSVLGLAPSSARTRWSRAKERFATALASLG